MLPRIAELLPPAHDILPQVQRPGRKHLRRRAIRPAEPVLNNIHDHIRHLPGHERLVLRIGKEVGKVRLQVRPQPGAEKVVERILPRERERAGIKRTVGVQIRAHAPEEVEQARLVVADGLLKALVVDPRHELVLVRKVPVERAAVDLRGRAQIGHGDVREVAPEHELLETLGEHFFRCGFAHGGRPLPVFLPPV